MTDTQKDFDFFSFLENDGFTEEVSEKQEKDVVEEAPMIDEKSVETPIEQEIEKDPESPTVVEDENKNDAPAVEEPKSEKKTRKTKSKSETVPETQAFQHTDVKLNLDSINFNNVTEKFIPSVSEDGDEWETIKAEIQKDLTE